MLVVKISQIFELEGEAQFRVYEKAALQTALTRNHVIIATGGGAVINPLSRKLMKEKAFVIAFFSTPEKILERIMKEEGQRPLLKTTNPLETIRELLSTRLTFYQEADFQIDTTQKTPEETAREAVPEILKMI